MSKPDFSLEVFPPKTAPTALSLWKASQELAPLSPAFISVTCGAGGNVPGDSTKEVALVMAQQARCPVAAHMTCVSGSRDELRQLAKDYWNSNIRHIVALRGDMPGQERYTPRPDGFAYADELVAGLKEVADFDISVAGYPEGHPDSASQDKELEYLKKKVEAGANRIITQFFFDPEVFLRYRDRVAAAGIDAQVVPGLLPILNFKRMTQFAARCQANVPDFLHKMFEGVEAEDIDHRLLAMNVLSHQITRLHTEGVDFFHIYTLNESMLTRHVCRWLREAF
ncbi:methylenetetrahydrofolate reductase [Balneatrix alpica]|uniref:Methylenetetrahydrofolate reductase n=1 Tax=Balneatrix alpica TaxID=75684 RepID=A0ABV5Z9J8_9GAMM|nr:methylenetetrahydrofolate reductase [Balneatrix alpica]